MAGTIQKILGTSSNSFSIGLKANKTTLTASSSSLALNKVLDMSSNKIINVANPVDNGDAVNLGYLNTEIAAIEGDISALSTKVTNLVATVGSNADGTNPGYSSTNYIVNTDSTITAIGKLDTALKANSDNDDTQDVRMDTMSTSLGLNNDGTKPNYSSNNYIDNTDSHNVALGLLDAQVGTNATNIATNTSDISALETRMDTAESDIDTLQTDVSNLTTEVNNIESGLGFNGDGTKPNFTSTNYINATDSVVTAINKIDGQVKINSDAIAVNSGDIDSLETRMTTAEGEIDTLQTEVADLQTEKADKVIGAVAGNIAELDASGNLVDSGIAADDVVTEAGTQSLTNKTIDVDLNTVSNIEVDNFKASAIANGTSGDNTKLATKGYVDESVASALKLQGEWDADTNTPDISGTTTVGFAWVVSVAGNTNLGGITDWQVNDWAVKTATGWVKIDFQDATAVWGNITGTLSNQTDLQNVLDEKMDLVSTPTNGHVLTTDASGQAIDSGTALSDVVTLTGTQTLTGKTIDADDNTISDLEVDNFKAGVVVTSISGSSSDSELPTAQAVYEAISASVTPGTCQMIEIPIALASATSTYTIPSGSRVKSVSLVIDTPYSSGATISVDVGAVNCMSINDNDAQTAGQYDAFGIKKIVTGSTVGVTIANAPAAGAGTVYVEFVASAIA